MNDNSAQLTALHTGASGIASLATGDVITASSGSQLTRQATLNVSQGGTGAATHTTGNTLVGAGTGAITSVATLGVDKGGTGAATFTDGGILLGSGTGAITPMAVLANSEMIVGNGATDPVAESGTTLRTSIGVGTGDSPQFTGIELGAASDTTLTRASAGNVSIEGNAIYRAGGTDVAIADGGTGAGTAAAGFAALSPLTTRGDILYSPDGTLTGARLGVGDADEVLTSDGTDVAWAAAGGGGGFSEFVLAYNESAISCANLGMTPLLMDAEKLDSDSMHDTGSNQARITFTTAGTYFIHMVAVTAAANAEWALYMLESDGPSWLYRDTRHITNSVAHTMQVSAILTRSAASYISMQMYQNSGGAQNVAAWSGSGSYSMPQTYMLAFRIA
jgi:hypothetical protein